MVNYQWMNSSWFYFMFSYYTSMKLVQRDLFPRTMLCRLFEVSARLTKMYYLLQVLWSTTCTQWSCNDFNIFTLNVKYLDKNSLHTTFSGHLRNYDRNQPNLDKSCRVYSCIPNHLYWDVLTEIVLYMSLSILLVYFSSKFDIVNSSMQHAVAFFVWELQCWWINLVLGKYSKWYSKPIVS